MQILKKRNESCEISYNMEMGVFTRVGLERFRFRLKEDYYNLPHNYPDIEFTAKKRGSVYRIEWEDNGIVQNVAYSVRDVEEFLEKGSWVIVS